MPSPKHRLTDGSPEYEYGIRTSPPPLAEVLDNAGCRLFLDAMRKAERFEGANSITIIAPNDGAFPSADAFDDSSWGLHIMDGAYKIGELVNFNGGRVQPQSLEPKHALIFRVEIGGHMVAYVSGETKPARRTRMVKTDLIARNGVFVHVVDKILYAE
ncbi:unnamed protein product [Ectocarpus sp. 6 AP-2014]